MNPASPSPVPQLHKLRAYVEQKLTLCTSRIESGDPYAANYRGARAALRGVLRRLEPICGGLQEHDLAMSRVALARSGLSAVLAAYFLGNQVSEGHWPRAVALLAVLAFALWDFCRRIIPPAEKGGEEDAE